MTAPARFAYTVTTVRVESAAPVYQAVKGMAGDPQPAAELIAAILRAEHAEPDTEVFGFVATDHNHRMTGYKILSRGTRTQALVDPARMFRLALYLDACNVIAFHTHPSGNLEASTDDCEVTKRLARAGQVLGLPLQDHIIINSARPSEWKSLRRSQPGLFGA